MKLLSGALISLFVSTTFAQVEGKPFSLDAGKYSESCEYVLVQEEEGHIQRYSNTSQSHVTVEKFENVTIETTVAEGMTTIVRSVIKDLGDSRFEIDSQQSVTTTSEGEVHTDKYAWTVTQKVDGKFNINESGIQDGVKRDNLVGELKWDVRKDKSISVNTYLREPTMITAKRSDGTEFQYKALVSNSNCVYKKLK